jgi:4-amino-4-deoxy-L-arabinose transferase-like glycosyltransferase
MSEKSEIPWRDHLEVLRCDKVAYAVAVLTFLAQVITAKGYGIFRDEFYYLAHSEHLSFGYVDHPPFIGLVAWLTRSVLGDSIYAIRFFPAVAAGLAVYLTAVITRQLGGGRFAQALAALAVAMAPGYLGLFSILSMNCFDVVFWALAVAVFVQILKSGDLRLWLVFGIVAGIGLENKISVLFLGFGIVVGLLLTRSWLHFRSKWFWLGGILSGVLFAPYLVWQVVYGWPTLEFMHNAATFKNVALTPSAFLSEQFLRMNPVALPLWLGGLVWYWVAREGRRYRALGWAFLTILAVMLTQNAKAYYLSPAFPMLFAAGSVMLERAAAHRSFGWLKVALPALVLISGCVLAPLAKPLLSVDAFVRYSSAIGIAPRAEERHELGRLPQYFADRFGWRELAVTVAKVYETLPSDDRELACVFGQNYGQAGAIDFFRKDYDLPPAISGHNSYFIWGPGDCTGEVLIVIGDEQARLEEIFQEVTLAGRHTCRDCMPYENEKPIWICRRARLSIEEVWPQVKSFN